MQIEDRHRKAAQKSIQYLHQVTGFLKGESQHLRKLWVESVAQIIAGCEASSDPLAVAVRMQKPHWINLTCMKCGYRYSGLTHAAPSACPNDEESLVPYDPPAQRIASLEAELAQVKAERDALAKRLGKPRCLDCNAAGMLNCSHFDNCDGQWEYSLERLCRELAVGLNSLLADQRVHLPVVPGSAGVRCLCYRCNALALLSRPEVVKLLEKEKV